MNKATKHVLLDFQDAVTAFSHYQARDSKERAMVQKSLEMMSKFHAAKEAEWKRFDVQIDGLESTLSRFQKEIKLIEQGKKWNVDAQKQMIVTGKEKTEKLVTEMMKKEREKCDAIGCECVERERLGNLLAPGLGTKVRDGTDRKKIMEILDGGEP